MEILASMQETLERLRRDPPADETPWTLLRRYTAAVDDLVQELHQRICPQPGPTGMALVAVGGYGRRELAPWSDIDLMFLCRETSSQATIDKIYRLLHLLWDLRLEVGHSVRTVEDCLEVSMRDLPTWTALMDARHLAGDEGIFGEFQERMRHDLFEARRESFLQLLVQGVWERHRRYARTPFLVEPHVKEGPGGLRDVQSALWLARSRFTDRNLADLVDHALLSRAEAGEVEEAHSFLWKVRLGLHRLAGRKDDHLTFTMQERLAREVPVGEEGGVAQVEVFMRHFYRHATRIRYFVEDIIQKATDPSLASGPQGPTFPPAILGDGFLVVRGRLTLLDDQCFQTAPAKMMAAIAFAHREGLDLDIFTRDEIKASLHLVDASFRRSRQVRDTFLSVLDSPDCGFKALELMHRLGLLQAYIPEFQEICFHVQHDAYHAYTVDFHSLEAVGELGRIRRESGKAAGDLPGSAVREVEGWRLLVLALLLHDVGKGKGSGHAQRGAEIVERLLRRWRLSKGHMERVIFLVREHLILMDTALGRDLTDEKVIADFARKVGSVARLNDLYLMTLADLRATGPDLLTDWKDQLLRELYVKARRLLESGELASPEAVQRIEDARARVIQGLRDELEGQELERWVQALPGRYLMTTPPEDVLDQVLLARDLVASQDALRLHHRRLEGYHELVICALDAPALFSRICGVLVAYGFNVLGARIHTWANGIVMDTFQVEPLDLQAPLDTEHLDRMSRDLAAVLGGRVDLKQLLSRRAPSPMIAGLRHPALQPRVRVDNRSSDFFTIVEVRARDRFGLLFAITHSLSALGLDIHLARIDTRRGQVADVFYVQEATGQKVWKATRLAALERALRGSLERFEDEGLASIG